MWGFKNALGLCPTLFSKILIGVEKTCPALVRPIATSTPLDAWGKFDYPKRFVRHNKTIFPPTEPDEPQRLAYVCHQKNNIKYSPDKMWYVASFVRGMSVDEALTQLNYIERKGAQFVRETILEAQKLAVEKHNVEFKSNLWVAESFASKGIVIKGIRRHARARVGKVEYKYCHYFVRLEEGKPPKDYYYRYEKTPDEMLQGWLDNMRKRKIYRSL